MKNTLLLIILSIFMVTSCKKVDLELDKNIGRGKAETAVTTHNPNIPTDTTTEAVSTEEECGEWIGEEYITYPCETTTTEETPPVTTEEETSYCLTTEQAIYAGAGGNDTTKGDKVGTVTYSNDGVNLYVTANYTGPTCPEEIHLWAGSDSSKVNGSFGLYPYKKDDADCGTHTFTIPLTDVYPSGDACGNDIYIVLHAAMSGDDSQEGSDGETAIAYGDKELDGSRWGWITTYTTCCAYYGE